MDRNGQTVRNPKQADISMRAISHAKKANFFVQPVIRRPTGRQRVFFDEYTARLDPVTYRTGEMILLSFDTRQRCSSVLPPEKRNDFIAI